MAKRPITIQLEPALIERIDAVRGKLARQVWIAVAAEQALAGGTSRVSAEPGCRRVAPAVAGSIPARSSTPAERPYRQTVPGPNVENIRSSAQIKRDIQERPKGGK